MRFLIYLAAAMASSGSIPSGFESQPRASAVDSPSSKEAAQTVFASSGELERALVQVVTEKKRYPLKLEEAPALFAPFGPLQKESPDPELLFLWSTPSPSTRLQVEFRANAKRDWIFSEMTVYLIDRTGSEDAFKRLGDLVTSRIGKPFRSKKKNGVSTAMVWRLRPTLGVWLSKQRGDVPGDKAVVDHVELAVGPPTEEVED
jgi:hypothetical protein